MPEDLMAWLQVAIWIVVVTAFVVTTRSQAKATQTWLEEHERREQAIHDQHDRDLAKLRRECAEAETRNQQAHLRLVQAVGWIQGKLNGGDPPPAS